MDGIDLELPGARVIFTLRELSATHASLTFDWENSAAFEEALRVTKATPGRTWKPGLKHWAIPIDHANGLATKLAALGDVLIEPVLNARLKRMRAAADKVADLAFLLDLPDWERPPGIVTPDIRGYQKVAERMLNTIEGGSLLGDPVGTGKTLDAILTHQAGGHIVGPNSILWVVPSGLRLNIRSQYKIHFGLDDAQVDELVTVIEGSDKKRRALWELPTPIKVVGYELYLRHDWGKPWVPRDWVKVFADEFTKGKNSQSQTHKRLQAIRTEVGLTGMTATPLEMHLEDVYNLVGGILRPGLLGNFTAFRDKFLQTDRWGHVVGTNWQTLPEFNEIIAPYIVRRRKEVLMPQLPEKVPVMVDVELSPQERRWYNMMCDDFFLWLATTGSDSKDDPLVQTLRLRQFLNSPNIVHDKYPVEGSKMDALFELLEPHDSDSVMMFSQWTSTAERIYEALAARTRHEVVYLHGGTPVKRRQEISDRVNAGEQIWVVASDAMAYGFDFYGASALVHYDCLWNPAKMIEQREGRLHRGGQSRRPVVYTMNVLDTFEQVVYHVMKGREALGDAVQDGTETALFRRWSRKDWKAAMQGEIPIVGEDDSDH